LAGPFRLLSKLGQGGVGVVYDAEVVATGQRVALKFLLDLRRLETSQIQRFRREGELAARLTHPGVVQVHAAGDIEGTPYLAYELVEGARPLDQAAADLDVAGRLELIRQVAEAVASAHSLGIVHRDLKPQNVLVDPAGRVRVCDFGLATASDLTRLTRSEAFLGTPTHMAPEQLEGASSENARAPAVDVWALGVILYECLTGQSVFSARSMIELLAQVSTAKIIPPSQHVPLGKDVDAVVLRALDRDCTRRYASAGELLSDLEALIGERSPEARRGQRARSLRFALVGLVAVGLVIGLGWKALEHHQASRRAQALEQAKSQLATIERGGTLLDELATLRGLDATLREHGGQEELRQQLAVRLGFGLLAAGRAHEAKPLLDLAREDPETGALRAAFALEAGLAPNEGDAKALQDSPLGFRELDRWRAALGLQGAWNPGLARRALGPLRRQGPAGRRWRAVLLARLGRTQEADALLAELAAEGRPPPGVAEAVGLGALSSALQSRNAEALDAAVQRIPRESTPLLAPWRRDAAERLAAASAATMLASLDKESDSQGSREEIEALRELLLSILAGIIRLDAGVTTDRATAGRFAAASALVGAPARDCVELLSAAHPDFPDVQVPLLALQMGVNATHERCVQALPIAARAAACTRDERRFVVAVFHARARWRLTRYAEALTGLDAVLQEAPATNQASLRFERARALRGLGRYEEALTDLGWILSQKDLAQIDSSLLRFERGQILNFLQGGAAASEDMAVFLRESDGVHGTGLYRLAAEILWKTDRESHAQTLVRMRKVSARSKSPAMRAWTIRVALLLAEAGDRAEAARALREAIQVMKQGDATIRAIGVRAEALAPALRESEDLTELHALVNELDEKRIEFGVAEVDLPEPFRPRAER